MLEWQLEDVSPADAAEIDLFGRAVGSTAQHKELGTRAVLLIPDDSEPLVYGSLFQASFLCYLHVVISVLDWNRLRLSFTDTRVELTRASSLFLQ